MIVIFKYRVEIEVEEIVVVVVIVVHDGCLVLSPLYRQSRQSVEKVLGATIFRLEYFRKWEEHVTRHVHVAKASEVVAKNIIYIVLWKYLQKQHSHN